MIKKIVPALLLGMVMTLASHRAEAGLTYQATDLLTAGDTTGERWKYRYHLDGPFSAFDSFNLLYNATEYASLVAVTVPLINPKWDQASPIIQPSGSGPGVVNFFANVDIFDEGADFEVAFDWKVSGKPPGDQEYDLFKFDPGAGFIVTQSRTTRAGTAVPEPATLPLVLAGLLLILRNIKRRQLRSLSN